MMRKRKTLTALSAAVMLGVSSVVMPVAHADVIGDPGKIGNGEYIKPEDVANASKIYKTYNEDGTVHGEWPMKLRPRMRNGMQVTREVNGKNEPVWDWYTDEFRVDNSTDYKILWEAAGVLDPQLHNSSTNGFLQNFDVEPLGPVSGSMEHFNIGTSTAVWRMQMTSAVDLHNVTMRLVPSSHKAPFLPTNGNGQSVLVNSPVTNDGSGELTDRSYYTRDNATYGTAFREDLAAEVVTGDKKEWNNRLEVAGEQLSWNAVQEEDDSWTLTIPYWPAGNHAVFQLDQKIDPNDRPEFAPFAVATIEADKFFYPESTVPQNGYKEVQDPTDPNYDPEAGGTSTPGGTKFYAYEPDPGNPDAPVTPDWVKVAEDGSLTLTPDYDVRVGLHRVPVRVDYPDDAPLPLPDATLWAQVYVTGTAMYDDATVVAGNAVVLNPNGEAAVPEDATFEVTNDAGFMTSINPGSGRLTVTTENDTKPGIYELEVTVTGPDGHVETTPVKIHVTNDIVDARIENGELIVTYANGEEKNLGPVGDQVEIVEGENGDGEAGYTITVTGADGTEQTVFIREGLDGSTPVIGENGNWWIGGKDTGAPARGEQGDSITVVGSEVDPETGETIIKFSDGSEVRIDAPERLTIVGQERDENGDVVVTFSDGSTIIIPAGKDGQDGEDGEDGQDGEDGTDGEGSADLSSGSSLSGECLGAGLAVGLPLLALIPIGIVSQMDIPAVSPLMGQVNSEINKLNVRVQQQLGLFNPDGAAATAEFNRVTGQVGQIAGMVGGGVLLAGLGLVVANYLAKACSPTGEGFLPGSSDGSAEGSSSSS